MFFFENGPQFLEHCFLKYTTGSIILIIATYSIYSKRFNSFQPSVPSHIETSHVIRNTNQMTGFYMECNIVLKCVKQNLLLNLLFRRCRNTMLNYNWH